MLAVVAQPKLARGGLPPGMGALRVSGLCRTVQPHARERITVTPVPPGQLRIVGQGRPLEPGLRGAIERLLHADLSGVRVHEGPAAPAMGALAFTVGDDIHFAPGRFDPSTRDGVALLGHELTHVVQQREGRVANPYRSGLVIVQDPALEAEADRVGRWIAEQVGSRRAAGGATAGKVAPWPGSAPLRLAPRAAAVQAMMQDSPLLRRIDFTSARHAETDRNAMREILQIPFYARVVQELLDRRDDMIIRRYDLTITDTRVTDRTNRALWDPNARQIRLRPEVEDGATRRELIKWELLNGWRRFDASGVNAQTGPVGYADLVETFEYGTAKAFAENWNDRDGLTFAWAPTLKAALREHREMSTHDWVTSMGRTTGDAHYRNAQERYLHAHGGAYLQTPGGLQWLASRVGTWFLETETWRGLDPSARGVIERGLRVEQERLARERDQQDQEIAELLRQRRAAAKAQAPVPGGRGTVVRQHERRDSPSPPPRRRINYIDVSVRESGTYRDRYVINSITIIYDDGSRSYPALNDGPLDRYYPDNRAIERDVAALYGVPQRDVAIRRHRELR
ncbi:MAG TPA: DUF4157 domain-containing protein [Kofleriaceae bacterium]